MAEVRTLNSLTGDLSIISGKGIEIQVGQPDITITNKGLLTLNGLSGQVNIVVGRGLSLSDSPPDLTIHNTGVLSFQGKSGQVELSAGTGIGITGLTISNTGVTELIAGDGIKLSANKGKIIVSSISKQDNSLTERISKLEQSISAMSNKKADYNLIFPLEKRMEQLENDVKQLQETFNNVLEELQKASPAKKKSIVDLLKVP